MEFFSSMVFLHLVRSCLISLPPDCHSASISSAFFALALIGCHNITMFNHSTFVLSYLLLFGYDVSGKAYQMRLISLFDRSCFDRLYSIFLSIARWNINAASWTYLKRFIFLLPVPDGKSVFSVGISSAMLIAALLNVPRVYWIGIAAMSVLIPFRKDVEYRTKAPCF